MQAKILEQQALLTCGTMHRRWQTNIPLLQLRLDSIPKAVLDMPYPDVVLAVSAVAVHGGRSTMQVRTWVFQFILGRDWWYSC